MERQRSQSAWVRDFFCAVFRATCWANSGNGSATRSSARADRERSRISWPGEVYAVDLGYARERAAVGPPSRSKIELCAPNLPRAFSWQLFSGNGGGVQIE